MDALDALVLKMTNILRQINIDMDNPPVDLNLLRGISGISHCTPMICPRIASVSSPMLFVFFSQAMALRIELEETLELLERTGGEDAFINIKWPSHGGW